MDHNQDRQTILSETQHRTCVLSKEILNLKDEKTKQVRHPTSALQTGQLKSSAFPQCPHCAPKDAFLHILLDVYEQYTALFSK